MKYVVIVPDGLGDWPIPELGNRTPLEAANLPHLHGLAKKFIVGTLRTTPDGMDPGSDVCGLTLMGYDPKECYSGRAPLEAANLGIPMQAGDLAFRTNLVSIEKDILADYSADHISTEEARELIGAVQRELGTDAYAFHAGKMYRHILLYKGKQSLDVQTTPPHDIQGQNFSG